MSVEQQAKPPELLMTPKIVLVTLEEQSQFMRHFAAARTRELERKSANDVSDFQLGQNWDSWKPYLEQPLLLLTLRGELLDFANLASADYAAHPSKQYTSKEAMDLLRARLSELPQIGGALEHVLGFVSAKKTESHKDTLKSSNQNSPRPDFYSPPVLHERCFRSGDDCRSMITLRNYLFGSGGVAQEIRGKVVSALTVSEEGLPGMNVMIGTRASDGDYDGELAGTSESQGASQDGDYTVSEGLFLTTTVSGPSSPGDRLSPANHWLPRISFFLGITLSGNSRFVEDSLQAGHQVFE